MCAASGWVSVTAHSVISNSAQGQTFTDFGYRWLLKQIENTFQLPKPSRKFDMGPYGTHMTSIKVTYSIFQRVCLILPEICLT